MCFSEVVVVPRESKCQEDQAAKATFGSFVQSGSEVDRRMDRLRIDLKGHGKTQRVFDAPCHVGRADLGGF